MILARDSANEQTSQLTDHQVMERLAVLLLNQWGNMHVDLMDDDPHFDDEIDTQVTDANGFIHFSVTESDLKEKSGEDKPDLHFNARPGGLVAGGVSLPG